MNRAGIARVSDQFVILIGSERICTLCWNIIEVLSMLTLVTCDDVYWLLDQVKIIVVVRGCVVVVKIAINERLLARIK